MNGKDDTAEAWNISPYLLEASNTLVSPRSTPLCDVPKALYGSKPADGGGLIVKTSEISEIALKEPSLWRFLKPFIGTDEFLYGKKRWCFWLDDVSPADLSRSGILAERVRKVREFRKSSPKLQVRNAAATPTLFTEIRQPSQIYLAVPEVSSERRPYIPMALMGVDIICSNKLQMVPGASTFQFGVLTSAIHMAWLRVVCGRLESRFDYSTTLVYNNYPWPEHPIPAHKVKVEELAQAVLDARALFPDSTLAQLYDPLSMPPALTKAHQALDRAVERCYRPEPFASDRERVEYLFTLYEKLTAPLLAAPKKKGRPKKAAGSQLPGR